MQQIFAQKLRFDENCIYENKKVKDYFKELGLPVIDESVGEIEDRVEHVLRYEFKGSEESFRMLKMCTQFVLDTFAKTDFEKFNIAIYGKRKKF